MAKNKLFLGEYIKEKGIDILEKANEKNVMIISPAGSGKTHYIFNELCNESVGKVLYLTDTSNLKYQVALEDKKNIDVITYMDFGNKTMFDNKFIHKYNLIIGDEFHNLFNYYGFNKDESLANAITKLTMKYQDTKIVTMTATSYDVELMGGDFENLGEHFLFYDFIEKKEVRRYYADVESKYTNFTQIPSIIKKFSKGVEYGDNKVLIFEKSIKNMNYIKEMIEKQLGLKCICLWSTHQNKVPMDDEQLKVRAELLTTEKLPNEYDVLIINRAYETGINITDERFKYCICNTTNVTQQIQARNRLRHNISMWAKLSTEKGVGDLRLTVPNEYLNRRLTKKDKDELVKYFDLRNCNGQPIKWTTISKIIIKSGYIITDERIRIESKRIRTSMIEEELDIE